jgi:CRP/FNR family cyclic AMP-dependent transcriptional regulator
MRVRTQNLPNSFSSDKKKQKAVLPGTAPWASVLAKTPCRSQLTNGQWRSIHALNNAIPGQRKRGYNVLERGMSGGVPMASPRESKASTKIAVSPPIEQKSQRTRNSPRPPPAPKNSRKFDPQVFLDTIGEGRKALPFPKKQTIMAQGDPADAVFYLRTGKVRLTVVSKDGKEATIGILSDGSFFGEGSLAGQPLRMGSATALTDCAVLRIEKKAMVDALHREQTLSDLFVAYLLTRNIRYEEDLVDQLFNSSEKRLARVLLMVAHFGKEGIPESVIPKISQETLAEMVGTTRSRVSFFMNRFRKLGFINYAGGAEGGLQVHSSLLNVVLHD